MARRVASGLAGLASAARLRLARGSAVLRGAEAWIAERDGRVLEASRRSAPASSEDEDGPLRWYRRRVREGALRADERQIEALKRLQDLRTRLVAPRGARLGREHAPWRATPLQTDARGDSRPRSVADVGVFFRGRFGNEREREPRSQGVYLHGGVGRGKTMLMDAFFATLPRDVKKRARRVHFHAFMAEVHARLHALSAATTRVRFAANGAFFDLDAAESRGAPKNASASDELPELPPSASDPLAIVASAIVAESPLVCFDEVELSDVADALVFKRVFEKVFDFGGALVATSNAAPDALYAGGINREAFAPFARTLESRTRVVDLDAAPTDTHLASVTNDDGEAAIRSKRFGVDHRRANRAGEQKAARKEKKSAASAETAEPPRPSVAAGARSVLLVAREGVGDARAGPRGDTTTLLLETWRAATAGPETRDVSIRVAARRELRVPAARGRGCRFSFRDLFSDDARLGAADYAALLARYDVVCVDTPVPTFAAGRDENALRRFVNFVDAAYDAKTLLVAATAREPEDLLLAFSEETDSRPPPGGTDDARSFSTRARVRLEGARGAFALAKGGGSSGRSAPMVGDMEWSATGRGGAALADLQATNFTFRAAARCVSRLVEMGGEAYEAAWWEEERARRRLERGRGEKRR